MIWNDHEKAETSGPLTPRPGISSSPPLFPASLVSFTFLLLSGFSYTWLCVAVAADAGLNGGRRPSDIMQHISAHAESFRVPLSSAALLKIGSWRFLWREQLWASLTSILLSWNNHAPKIGKTSQRQHLFLQLFNVQKINIFISTLHIYFFSIYLFLLSLKVKLLSVQFQHFNRVKYLFVSLSLERF